MSVLAAFVLGLIVGWVIEWIIDWIYWRRKTTELTSRLDGAENRLTQQSDLKMKANNQADLEHQIELLKANNAELQQKLETLDAEKQAWQAPAATRAASIPVVPDDLIVINGIGPVIARKLNEAGILTFAQLAALTPERLREIVGDVIQRLANEEDILNQARALAASQNRAENS